MSKGKYKNRQAYIDAALNVIAAEGVAKLSMRKMASYLNVCPMAAYKHFANKDELLTAALDEFIFRSKVLPPNELPWDEWVTSVAQRMYNALSGTSSWVPILSSIQNGSQAIAVTESFIEKLLESGFSRHDAVRGYYAMLQLVMGSVLVSSTIEPRKKRSQVDNTAHFRHLIDQSNIELKSVFDEVFQLPQIELGLPYLIDGLKQRLNN